MAEDEAGSLEERLRWSVREGTMADQAATPVQVSFATGFHVVLGEGPEGVVGGEGWPRGVFGPFAVREHADELAEQLKESGWQRVAVLPTFGGDTVLEGFEPPERETE